SGYSGTAASAAARLSLLSGFRGEMQMAGIRVMSVLTGPVDDAWHQRLPQPKVAPSQLARTVVAALRDGQEISCAGDVAKDLFARWQANPLLTMREENR
ncbi:MAG: short-chain dehydrogenase, partial [Albidovulum sp.]